MKLLVEGKNVSELIESISWGGDTKQVARKVNFTIAKNGKDKSFPKVVIHEGDKVILRDDKENDIFFGIVFDIDKSAESNVMSYLAFDFMFYVNNSEVNEIFDDTPENIVKEISKKIGVKCGNLAKTDVKVYMPCLGKKAYEAIMMAYTKASKKNGKKYIPLIQNKNELVVIEKGKTCGVILGEDYNLNSANYKSSLQNLVNKVLITDKKGHLVKTVEDKSSQEKYGTVQIVYKQEEDKDASIEAKHLLTTKEQTASVSGIPNDFRAVAGYSLVIREAETGLYGVFYIEADTHTYSNGKSEMQLTLAFENLMDEKEIETVKKESKG